MANSVEDMDVFKKAHTLTLELYRFTNEFPSDERYQVLRREADDISKMLRGLIKSLTYTNH